MLMTVMVPMPREKWADERLDDLDKKVNEGFTRVEGEIKRLDGSITRVEKEIKRLDGNLGEQRREINARFEAMDLRFDSLNRSLQATTVAVVVALIGSNAF
jgi:flagellar capping protein FliD